VPKTTSRQVETALPASGSFSWWSWRPGFSPRLALLIGLPFIFLAVFLITVGFFDLLFGISDSHAQPQQLSGLVLGYSMNGFDHLPQLTIRLDQPAISAASIATVSVPVSPAMQKAIHPGDRVVLDYSPRLHTLYALQVGASRFDVPGSSVAGNMLGSLLLFLLGCLLLPYPLFLTLGGWHDLQNEGQQFTGRIVGLRSPPTRLRRASLPGLTPRIGRSWYGMALQHTGADVTQETSMFRVSEDQFHTLREGQSVCVTCTPHLHYMLSVRQVEQTFAAGRHTSQL